MDPNIPENAPFFSVLFRHMQMSCMLGCPSVAAEVGKLLLSLDPQGDRYHVLLSLDHFLTASGKHTQLLDIMGLSGVEAKGGGWGGGSGDSEGGKGAGEGGGEGGVGVGEDSSDRAALWSVEHTDYSKACFSSPVDVDHDRAHRHKQKQREREREREDVHEQPLKSSLSVSVPLPLPLPQLRHLPNWWFSLALSTFIQEKAADTTAASSSSSSSSSSSKAALTSDEILLKALSVWPYVLQPLLKRAGVQTGSSHWRYIFAHPFFATAPSRYEAGRGN
jgi:hypothetical protein